MTWIIISIQLSVIAYVYSVLLTRNGMLLGVVYGWLTQIEAERPAMEWLFKPLMTCVYCVSGQMALWTLILFGCLKIAWVPVVIDALFFLSLTILWVHFLNKLFHE